MSRLRRRSNKRCRSYLDRLANVNGFIGLDHRLDVLGACSDCQDQAPGAGEPLASAVAVGQRDG